MCHDQTSLVCVRVRRDGKQRATKTRHPGVECQEIYVQLVTGRDEWTIINKLGTCGFAAVCVCANVLCRCVCVCVCV